MRHVPLNIQATRDRYICIYAVRVCVQRILYSLQHTGVYFSTTHRFHREIVNLESFFLNICFALFIQCHHINAAMLLWFFNLQLHLLLLIQKFITATVIDDTEESNIFCQSKQMFVHRIQSFVALYSIQKITYHLLNDSFHFALDFRYANLKQLENI